MKHPNIVYNEREALSALSAGKACAFCWLFDTYRTKLYNYVFKLTESKETAEDTVHDIFLKIWQQKERLSQVTDFNAYLYTMVRNDTYNKFRRMAKKNLILSTIGRTATKEENTIEDNYTAKEIRQNIRQLVEKLTPQQQLVFNMSREEGLKNEEIARQLNVSVLTVKKHLTNALHILRHEICVSTEVGFVAMFLIVEILL